MQTHEKIAVTKYTIEEVEDLYAFDAKHSELLVSEVDKEIYEFGPCTRTYWFNGGTATITHTQLQFDENWVEPEGLE